VPKKIKFESFKYRFLIAANKTKYVSQVNDSQPWEVFLDNLRFEYEKASIKIFWSNHSNEFLEIDLNRPLFYCRGDSIDKIALQKSNNYLNREDPVKINNENYFNEIAMTLAKKAGYKKDIINQTERLATERDFHNKWASQQDISSIDILKSNQVCTAPEMRYLTKKLGNIQNKKLLDVGCGLGEASVYFAILGAKVTASDLSDGMLKVTSLLAKKNNVTIKTHLASAENMNLLENDKFDIIYLGNLLHHVNIDNTLQKIKKHLKEEGVLASWDPLAYNPIINVYRKIAMEVRTEDEHPLRVADIKTFKSHFKHVETKYFWFFTLIIFLVMALVQRRDPNKERFWKVVLAEGDKWRWLYKPLELLDKILLVIFPPLRLLCWNIVIIAKSPK
jgi:2-polyprenyl-3-methyl-5-hydroxy-6-metoxy-1,4-benzoquinol methylase